MSYNVKLIIDLLGKSVDPIVYRSMIGILLYLIASRLDISLNVGLWAMDMSWESIYCARCMKRIRDFSMRSSGERYKSMAAIVPRHSANEGLHQNMGLTEVINSVKMKHHQWFVMSIFGVLEFFVDLTVSSYLRSLVSSPLSSLFVSLSSFIWFSFCFY